MQNTFKQRVPNFVDISTPPPSFTFNSTEELLANEWIRNWSTKKDFYRYSLSREMLMAEFEEGKVWWALGYIGNPELVNLPKWEPKEAKNNNL